MGIEAGGCQLAIAALGGVMSAFFKTMTYKREGFEALVRIGGQIYRLSTTPPWETNSIVAVVHELPSVVPRVTPTRACLAVRPPPGKKAVSSMQYVDRFSRVFVFGPPPGKEGRWQQAASRRWQSSLCILRNVRWRSEFDPTRLPHREGWLEPFPVPPLGRVARPLSRGQACSHTSEVAG